MNRTPGLIGLAALLGALLGDGSAPLAGPLRVSARSTTPGPLLVGQAIEIQVEVEGAGPGGTPEVIAPRPPEADATLHRLAIGEAGLSSARFVVVARHSGPLVVAPFRVRSGDRTGASRPVRLAIETVPTQGRSAAFLGGVGPFHVGAEADPSRLRLGQSLEYRLRLTGPAAWGSDRPPDLGGWGSLTPGFRVEPLPGHLDGLQPATRTFRYRLRPTRAGRLVLPPVPVAALDPATRRYTTRLAPGVPIEVEGPPRFDPARLDYEPGRAKADPDRARTLAWMGLGLAAGLAVVVAWLRWRRARASRRVDPLRLARDLARGLVEEHDQAEAARQVAEALATFLRRVGGQALGVLTPPEARVDVERLTLDRGLAESVGKLVESCDRARYGSRGDGAEGLRSRGRAILERLGEATGPPGGGPGEAVETART